MKKQIYWQNTLFKVKSVIKNTNLIETLILNIKKLSNNNELLNDVESLKEGF